MPIPTCIALIPARAGSKRVKNKNVRLLGGHPLLAYTIVAAKTCGVFKRVIVSTDSAETGEIAKKYGAEVPWLRPPEFATDISPDIEWLEHTLRTLSEHGERYDAFALLRPTSPFRQVATIQRAWNYFISLEGVDSIRAIEPCTQHPAKMWQVTGEGSAARIAPVMVNPDKTTTPWHSTPYQVLPKIYAQNASLEIAWTRVPLEQHAIAGQVIAPFFTQGQEGFDINNPADWIIAEYMVEHQQVSLPAIS
jgi:CMP-N-acetylneuraminic acid synthetase